jgi:TonB family protein
LDPLVSSLKDAGTHTMLPVLCEERGCPCPQSTAPGVNALSDCEAALDRSAQIRQTVSVVCADAMKFKTRDAIKVASRVYRSVPCYLAEAGSRVPLRGSPGGGKRRRAMKQAILAVSLVLAVVAAQAQSVVVQHGNLVFRDTSGATELLTETGADGNPVISPDGSLVAFTRLHPGEEPDSNVAGNGSLSDIYVIRISDHVLRKLTTSAHSAQPENELSGINSLKFSPDAATLYFQTAAWMTSGAIHAVRVQGGREWFVTNGNGFAVVQHGKYAGYLVANQHRYMEGHGSWDPYVLVSPEGKEIRVLGEFGDDRGRAEMAALQSVEGASAMHTPAPAEALSASPGYLEKVQRRVRPNIVWAGETPGLETVVTIHCSPTGTLLSATIALSSGNSQWDDAALRAVQRSDPMPLDTNGKAPASFTVTLRPAG